MDDIGWKSNGTTDEGLSIAQSFHAAMSELPYLAAVIPSSIDAAGAEWLQSKPEGMTVGMHGYSHRPAVTDGRSEFAGMSEKRIRDRIAAGNQKLGGIAEHFILPWNAYEADFAEAAYHEGVRYIWGAEDHGTSSPSTWPTPPQPYSLGRITFVPAWLLTYGVTIGKMSREDIPLCGTLPVLIDRKGKAVITLHITWEYSKSATFDGVKWLVDTIGDRVISADEFLKSGE